jgi:hypothetical protein
VREEVGRTCGGVAEIAPRKWSGIIGQDIHEPRVAQSRNNGGGYHDQKISQISEAFIDQNLSQDLADVQAENRVIGAKPNTKIGNQIEGMFLRRE